MKPSSPQILLGFELASSDPRFVGLNLVMPEDWYVPIHDFNEHMAMLDYLHGVYPKVHISLHAGELAMGLVKPEDLSFHIRASIERGHAERIGHGVSVMLEKDPIGLLKEMAARNVLVEINLTSNDQILDVSGDDHPLPDVHEIWRPGRDLHRRRRRLPLRHDARISARCRRLPAPIRRTEAHREAKPGTQLSARKELVETNESDLCSRRRM